MVSPFFPGYISPNSRVHLLSMGKIGGCVLGMHLAVDWLATEPHGSDLVPGLREGHSTAGRSSTRLLGATAIV